ncbi:MAG: hypothetical protein ACRC4H_07495, partial [Plesiomonas sp.]
ASDGGYYYWAEIAANIFIETYLTSQRNCANRKIVPVGYIGKMEWKGRFIYAGKKIIIRFVDD